ncbi:hypothetical protein D3875_03550 [Deinococcus cavernae]|uniref:Uncharacterized protein n=2 Tax=Deinococcus cavernae TaxID=2320857 RepID=A0A418VEU7_9DEIO|nr:hypothetical protein [Deinococcus cavernae]RJF74629.1 hypothetical protein D3875_03550 [Deinococcus cavernae]
MAYRKLSELAGELENPQQSEKFVQLFKAAVRDGKIDAMDVPERFTLPKVYTRRGAEGTYQRDQRDMVFEVTPQTEAWFKDTNEALSKAVQRPRRVKLSLEAVESGAVDFKAAAEETRRKMQAKFEKGQQLGQSRSKNRKKKK